MIDKLSFLSRAELCKECYTSFPCVGCCLLFCFQNIQVALTYRVNRKCGKITRGGWRCTFLPQPSVTSQHTPTFSLCVSRSYSCETREKYEAHTHTHTRQIFLHRFKIRKSKTCCTIASFQTNFSPAFHPISYTACILHVLWQTTILFLTLYESSN